VPRRCQNRAAIFPHSLAGGTGRSDAPAPGPPLTPTSIILHQPLRRNKSRASGTIFSSLFHRSGWSLIEASQLFRSLVFSTDRRCGLPFACSSAAFSNTAGHSTSNPLWATVRIMSRSSITKRPVLRSSHSLHTAKLKGPNSSGKRSFVVCHWACRFSPACCSLDQPASSSFVCCLASKSFVSAFCL
jgi:hypothetical protein